MTTPKRTEAELLAMLRDRYTEKGGNGDAWAFIPKVRDAAGFDAKRTIDALAMSLWPSRGLHVYGFEIKCSRTDWLRELKNPEKAEAFGRVCDFFYLVVSDAKIVKDGELPEPWGLLVVRGQRLVQTVEPKALHDLTPQRGAGSAPLPAGVARTFIASLLRAACRTRAALPEELAAEFSRGREAGKGGAEQEIERLKRDLEEYRAREQRFHELTGVGLRDFSYRQDGEPSHLEQVARAVKAAMNGEVQTDRLVNRLAGMRRSGEELLDTIDRTLASYRETPLLSQDGAP